MSHTCHAHACTVVVPPARFMCSRHWVKLRKVTRDAIWREYRPGQERDKKPSLRYLAVQRWAVSESAFRPNDEAAALLTSQFLAEAIRFQKLAIEAGLGDPLETLVAAAQARQEGGP